MEITKVALDFLNTVGTQISTTGKQVLAMYTRQAYAQGMVSLITAGIELLAFLGCVVGIILCVQRYHIKSGDHDSDAENFAALAFVLGIAAICFIVMVVRDTQVGVLRVMNPEYYAVQQLLDTFKAAAGK